MAVAELCDPETHYGASDTFPRDPAGEFSLLAAEAQWVVGFDSPDLASAWGEGRFTQTDPIRSRRSGSHYIYAANDPVSRTDPSGLQDTPTPPTPAPEDEEAFVSRKLTEQYGATWTRLKKRITVKQVIALANQDPKTLDWTRSPQSALKGFFGEVFIGESITALTTIKDPKTGFRKLVVGAPLMNTAMPAGKKEIDILLSYAAVAPIIMQPIAGAVGPVELEKKQYVVMEVKTSSGDSLLAEGLADLAAINFNRIAEGRDTSTDIYVLAYDEAAWGALKPADKAHWLEQAKSRNAYIQLYSGLNDGAIKSSQEFLTTVRGWLEERKQKK